MVVDVYVAYILNQLSEFAGIPYPSKEFDLLKVIFPYYTARRLKNEGNEKILYQFKNYKITKEEVRYEADNIVMVVRTSMQKDLQYIPGIDGGNLIYSMWEGYLQKSTTRDFIDYLKSRKFTMYQIHTSGHADLDTLKQMVDAIKPKNIVPIHTFSGDEYNKLFDTPIVLMNDNEICKV
jgi:ribonuclease J